MRVDKTHISITPMEDPQAHSSMIEEVLWRAFNVLRGSMPVADFHVISVLLHLTSEGLMDGLEKVAPESVYSLLRDRITRSTTQPFEQQAFDAFESAMKSLNAFQWDELLYILSEIQSISGGNLDTWIEKSVELVNQVGGETLGEHVQPEDLTRFIVELVTLPDTATVYNPFAGQASFGVHFKDGIRYHGEEINDRTAAIGGIRLMARERRGGTSFGQGDSIQAWSARKGQEDLIIATPPMGMRINRRESVSDGNTMVDAYFLKHAIKDVKADGKVVAVLSGSALFQERTEYKSIREHLVGADILDMVVAFPERLLANTSIPFFVLVMDKAKQNKGLIRFVTAEAFVDRGRKAQAKIRYQELIEAIRVGADKSTVRNVPVSEVIKNDFDLNPKRYFADLGEQEGDPLSTILSALPGKRIEAGVTIAAVRTKDLKETVFDHVIEFQQLEERQRLPSARLVNSSALLVAMRGNSLKPTYFEYQGKPIQVSSDVGVYKLDTNKVDVQYLIVQLLNDNTVRQAEALRVGTFLSSLRSKDFLSIRVPMPRLAVQTELVLKEKERLLGEREAELQDFQTKLGLDKHRRTANGYLRHSIAAPLGNMRHYLQELKEHLQAITKAGKPLQLEQHLGAGADETVTSVLARLERRLIEVSDEVRRSDTEVMDVRNLPLTELSLHDFLEDFHRGQRSNIHMLHYTFDKAAFPDASSRKAATIKAEKGLLEKLLYNLINNADVHAFNNTRSQDNLIDLRLTQETKPKPSLLLRVANSGASFPPGFTMDKYIEKGMRSGTYQGDGMGGYIINEIVEHMGGSFDLDIAPGDKRFATVFTFLFPLTIKQ